MIKTSRQIISEQVDKLYRCPDTCNGPPFHMSTCIQWIFSSISCNNQNICIRTNIVGSSCSEILNPFKEYIQVYGPYNVPHSNITRPKKLTGWIFRLICIFQRLLWSFSILVSWVQTLEHYKFKFWSTISKNPFHVLGQIFLDIG